MEALSHNEHSDPAWLEATLTPEEAAEFLKVKPEWLARKRSEGEGPQFRKLGARTVRYVRGDLIAWRDMLGLADRNGSGK